MNDISLTPIGILRCDLKTVEQTPKSFKESSENGVIEIEEKFLKGLYGIGPGDTIIVLFWFNKADRTLLEVHPRGDKSKPKQGVFSTRSPARPNPIAVSELRVTAVSGNKISVTAVDALDMTPVLDIKKSLCRKES